MNADFQEYKYNGKEFDKMHGLNTYDYGARQHDPLLCRWDRMDPLCEKYYSVSPYAYCCNNPVKFIDPDGMDLYLAGTYEEKMLLLKLLQSLTNDRLDMNRRTGQVTIGKYRTKNNGKHLSVGTGLISGIIKNEHSLTIGITHEEPSHETDKGEISATNGNGTDCSVEINPEGAKVLTKNEKTGKRQYEEMPLNLIVGHEIIHGYRSMNGIAKNGTTTYTYKDKNGILYKVYNEKVEELETVGIQDFNNYKYTENKLRKEQNANKRIKY